MVAIFSRKEGLVSAEPPGWFLGWQTNEREKLGTAFPARRGDFGVKLARDRPPYHRWIGGGRGLQRGEKGARGGGVKYTSCVKKACLDFSLCERYDWTGTDDEERKECCAGRLQLDADLEFWPFFMSLNFLKYLYWSGKKKCGKDRQS